MISEWFLSIGAGFLEWLASLMGEWTPPAELTGFVGGASDLLGTMSSMGVWVNWAVLGACVASSVGVVLAILILQTVRAGAAHIPFIGGNGP